MKKISKYRNRIGRKGSTIRGAARDLDIILDEEEDADQDQDQDFKRKSPNFAGEGQYNTIDQNGSICFFNKTQDDDYDSPEQGDFPKRTSVHSSIEFKEKKHYQNPDLNQITSLSQLKKIKI